MESMPCESLLLDYANDFVAIERGQCEKYRDCIDWARIGIGYAKVAALP